jgi:hypothetical protein
MVAETSVSHVSAAFCCFVLSISKTHVLVSFSLLQYWKGSHYIAANPKVVEEYWRIYSGAGGRWLEVDLKCLHWQPLTTGPGRPK